MVSLNLLDPLLDAMEVPQDPPAKAKASRSSRCSIRTRIAWPRSPSNIPTCRTATNSSGSICTTRPARRIKPRVQYELLREAEAKYDREHRREACRTGSGACWRSYIAQPRAHQRRPDLPRVYDLAVAARSIVDDNYGWEVWQMAGRYPAQHEDSRTRDREPLGRRDLAQHQAAKIRRRLPRPKQRHEAGSG